MLFDFFPNEILVLFCSAPIFGLTSLLVNYEYNTSEVDWK